MVKHKLEPYMFKFSASSSKNIYSCVTIKGIYLSALKKFSIARTIC